MSKIRSKIYPLDALVSARSKWRKEGKKVVFTNGCFDLIHPGHVLYMESAKSLGQKLVVAINSDDSVRRLKGPQRPIQNHTARMTVMAALESVDAVVCFEDDTPLALIEALLPDILVKGGDWSIDQIVGADVVLENGGEVKSLQFEDGFSTTSIVEKIANHEGQ